MFELISTAQEGVIAALSEYQLAIVQGIFDVAVQLSVLFKVQVAVLYIPFAALRVAAAVVVAPVVSAAHGAAICYTNGAICVQLIVRYRGVRRVVAVAAAGYHILVHPGAYDAFVDFFALCECAADSHHY